MLAILVERQKKKKPNYFGRKGERQKIQSVTQLSWHNSEDSNVSNDEEEIRAPNKKEKNEKPIIFPFDKN